MDQGAIPLERMRQKKKIPKGSGYQEKGAGNKARTERFLDPGSECQTPGGDEIGEGREDDPMTHHWEWVVGMLSQQH